MQGNDASAAGGLGCSRFCGRLQLPVRACAAWVRAHKALRPGNKVLQKELDAWVAAYEDEDERKQKEKTAAMAEDGWTVVVRSKVGFRAWSLGF